MRKLTNSMRSKFNACHRAFKFCYEDLIRPVKASDALTFGTAMHSLLEEYWGTEETRGEKDFPTTGDEYSDMTLRVLAAKYQEKWSSEDEEKYERVGAEIGFEAPLMNPETGGVSKTFVLAGKIDAIAREKATGKLLIIEHKTTSYDIGPGSEYWMKLPIDGQVSGYYVGAQSAGYEVENCLYDVIRKPTIRPCKVPLLDENNLKVVVDIASGERVMKKDGTPRQSAGEGMELVVRDETPEEWGARLAADIDSRPDYYFARVEVARSENDLVDYLFDMWAASHEIMDAERLGRWSRNPSSCNVFGKCEYFDVCTGCASLEDNILFKKVDDPNPELN